MGRTIDADESLPTVAPPAWSPMLQAISGHPQHVVAAAARELRHYAFDVYGARKHATCPQIYGKYATNKYGNLPGRYKMAIDAAVL